MNGISLIVRGDGFGSCHSCNQAICEAFETGLLTCASLVVTTPWLAEALTLVHEHAEWEIGLQLALQCPTTGYRWGPVSGARVVPSLVDARGVFPPSLAAAAQEEDIAREMDAQLERAQRGGLRPAYLEYEGADHSGVEGVLQRLSERLGLPARMSAWGIRPLALSELSEGGFQDALALLRPGTYLWRTHPAHDAPETWALWAEQAARARHAEFRALCSPEIRAFLDQRRIERISFRQYLEERLGTDTEE